MRSFEVLFAPTTAIARRAVPLRRHSCLLGAAAAIAAHAVALPAFAQAPGRPPIAQPGRRGPAKPAPAPPPTTAATPDVMPGAALGDLGAFTPGGLTADQVGQRAMASSYQAKAAEQNVTAAGARAEQQWTNYVPRLGLTARYTRFSSLTPPVIGGGNGSTVATTDPPGTINPTNTFAAPPASFPVVLDQYFTQAAITVPISDYFLRINKAYTSATQSEEAARFDVTAARYKSYADGKVAYYTWLRARGAVIVAGESLAVARSHLKDAENQFNVGNASKADVLRAQTQVASAELAVERAKGAAAVTEHQVRVAMHAKDEEGLTPGDSVDGALPPAPTNLKTLVAEAQASRPEIKSIDKNAEAARKLADVSRAGRYPVLSAFGETTYANPNQRRFPQREEWFPTWSAGAQITWSPSDYLAAGPSAGEAEARAAALEAQKSVVRDGIESEVTQAYQDVVDADFAVGSTQRQLESSVEGYRVARELFNNGRGTATTLIDAEIVLAQTRFEYLNARVDARIARVRLDYAMGHETK